MQISSLRSTQLLLLLGTVSISGCMNPGMYYGNPYQGSYGQPMYAPPQSLNQGGYGGAIGGPGFLSIPETSAPAYAPGTFESDLGDPTDGFDKANQSPFYGTPREDEVPTPRGFGDNVDDLGSGVQYFPSPEYGQPRPSSIQPVSANSAPVEYGFDSENYQWLRGVVHFDDKLQAWYINYSPAAQDRYRGNLVLTGTRDLLEGLRSGDMIDVRGHVDAARNGQNLPTYHIESLRRVAM